MLLFYNTLFLILFAKFSHSFCAATPGIELFQKLRAEFGKLPIVAEDLGEMFDSVRRLLKKTGFPGMRVMQFGFAPYWESEHLPHNYPVHCVAYPGTHDNNTVADWLQNGDPGEVLRATRYLGLNEKEGMVEGFLRGVLASPAELVIVPMADWMGLGAEGRINTPGVVGNGNWSWRCMPGSVSVTLARRVREQCRMYGRAPFFE